MDDQHFAEDLSLESLIRQGRVTHLCSGDAGLDETAVLTALCEAVEGQIYRIDPLTYVFRVGGGDLGGTLAGTPPEDWAEALAGRLRAALRLPGASGDLQVRALRRDAEAEPEAPAVAEPAAPGPVEAAPALEDRREAAPDAGAEGEGAPLPALARADGFAEAPAPLALNRPVGVEARLEALELRLGELQAAVQALAGQAGAQAEAGRSLERTVGALAEECRGLPERAAQAGALAAPPPDLAPLEEGLALLRDAVLALSGRLAEQPPLLSELAGRLDRLEAGLGDLPELAAAQVAARTGDLAPMQLALSGALHRLERQVEALAPPDPGAGQGPDAGLRLAMAEFLARLEQRIALRIAD